MCSLPHTHDTHIRLLWNDLSTFFIDLNIWLGGRKKSLLDTQITRRASKRVRERRGELGYTEWIVYEGKKANVLVGKLYIEAKISIFMALFHPHVKWRESFIKHRARRFCFCFMKCNVALFRPNANWKVDRKLIQVLRRREREREGQIVEVGVRGRNRTDFADSASVSMLTAIF